MSHAEDDQWDDHTTTELARKLLERLQERGRERELAIIRKLAPEQWMMKVATVSGRSIWATMGPGGPRRVIKDGKMSMTTTVTIVGSQYHSGAEDHLKLLDRFGDNNRPLSLKREPNNKHDRNAVAVYDWTERLHLGYVPRQDAVAIAKVMDAGIRVQAWYRGYKEMKVWWPASNKADLERAWEKAMG